MTCFSPLTAWRVTDLRDMTSEIVFNKPLRVSSYKSVDEMKLPCGNCSGCRLARSRDWAIRCVHESATWHDSCFITLTYDDNHLPPDGSVWKSDFQKFMKRLRKRFSGYDFVEQNGKNVNPIRFFACGEYGEKRKRPHYHAILFNFDFADKQLVKYSCGYPCYISPALAELWPFGYHEIGTATFESCAYVARYILKKQKDDWQYVDPETGVLKEKEFILMSRNPGIGAYWIEKYMSDVYPRDYVLNGQVKMRPPRYYDNVFKRYSPEILEIIKDERAIRAASSVDNTPERLAVREKVQLARLKSLKRNMESE